MHQTSICIFILALPPGVFQFIGWCFSLSSTRCPLNIFTYSLILHMLLTRRWYLHILKRPNFWGAKGLRSTMHSRKLSWYWEKFLGEGMLDSSPKSGHGSVGILDIIHWVKVWWKLLVPWMLKVDSPNNDISRRKWFSGCWEPPLYTILCSTVSDFSCNSYHHKGFKWEWAEKAKDEDKKWKSRVDILAGS